MINIYLISRNGRVSFKFLDAHPWFTDYRSVLGLDLSPSSCAAALIATTAVGADIDAVRDGGSNNQRNSISVHLF